MSDDPETAPSGPPKFKPMKDEFDMEVRALDVAHYLAQPGEEQFFFPPIRDAMFEAFSLGQRSRTIRYRARQLITRLTP